MSLSLSASSLILSCFQLFVFVSFVFAIAGAAVTKWSDDYYSIADVDFEKLDAALAERDGIKKIFKTAQDLFICIIVWSLIAMIVGITSYLANRSPSTMYEVGLYLGFTTASKVFYVQPKLQVNEKTSGVDNAGFEKKEEKKDIEKGDDEKWKANYVPYEESKENKELE